MPPLFVVRGRDDLRVSVRRECCGSYACSKRSQSISCMKAGRYANSIQVLLQW